jgi:hypothetical protein
MTLGEQIHRPWSVAGFQDLIADQLETGDCQLAHPIVVLNDEDGLARIRISSVFALGRGLDGDPVHAREIQIECRSVPELAVDGDMTA